jgi:hypothetical protein
LHSDAFVFLGPKGIDPLRPPKLKRGTKWLAPSEPDVKERDLNVTTSIEARADDNMPSHVDVDGTVFELQIESGDPRAYTSYLHNDLNQANQGMCLTT